MSLIRTSRVLLAALALGAIALVGCTPEEVALFQRLHAEQLASDKFRHVVSDEGLKRLRQCESTDNYQVTSSSGRYRGAYQFHQGTWNGVAQRHYPGLVGIDPAAASPFDQDRMARALWAESGRQPWPHCGKRV